MLFGVGATLARRLPPDELRVLPAPSSLSLAAARMGWPLQDVATVSLVGRPLATLNARLYPGRASVCPERRWRHAGGDRLRCWLPGVSARPGCAYSNIWAARTSARVDLCADAWRAHGAAHRTAALNLVALECRPGADARLPLTPGLPDDAFLHDGQPHQTRCPGDDACASRAAAGRTALGYRRG